MTGLIVIGVVGMLYYGFPIAGDPFPANNAVRRFATAGDRDCSDFRTQTEAQAFYRSAGRGDPHRLDEDRDGIACEYNAWVDWRGWLGINR
jgi:hypothetical protein